MYTVKLSLLVASVLFIFGCNHKSPSVVTHVDLDRYSGCWYQISAIPIFGQRDCVASRAVYKKISESEISILNECYKNNRSGEVQNITGRGWIEDSSAPAKLKIQFNRWWGRLARGDYWIVDLDPNYEWAVVSGPSMDTLWILSRTPKLDDSTYSKLISNLKEKGFPVEKLRVEMDQFARSCE